jgi:glycosyltransferase involved in cell wall biosynthesis
MKILIVSEPGENGVFRQVENLADHLIARGHVVSLAYSDLRGSDRLQPLVQRVERAGGLTVNLRVVNHLEAGDFRALFRLWRIHRRFQPDVVHAHSAKAGGLVRLLRRLGTPAFYTPHAYYGMGRTSSLRTLFFNSLERFLAANAMTLHTSADEAEFAHEVLHVPRLLQRVVRNGVDTQLFKPCSPAEKANLRAEFGIPAHAVVLGTLGRFSYQKDPVTLHQAFRACADRMPNLHLVHVGAGELRPGVQQYARSHGYHDRVTWIEYLRDPTPFYRLLDGFILTSRYEGLSLAVLEALATDLPIMLSDAPGNRGFTSAGLSHFWSARIESPESFASAITSWYDDRARARPCNHRAIALEQFSQQAQFQTTEELYHLALASRPAPRVPDPVTAR